MWEYNHTEELFHYGVKGMQWGVRNEDDDGTVSSRSYDSYNKELQSLVKGENYHAAISLSSRAIKDLSKNGTKDPKNAEKIKKLKEMHKTCTKKLTNKLLAGKRYAPNTNGLTYDELLAQYMQKKYEEES